MVFSEGAIKMQGLDIHGFLESSINSVGAAAMLLAITQTIYDEDRMKQLELKMALKL